MQQRLMDQDKQRTKYDYPQVDYIYKNIQRIETSRGCPHQCPFCYEPNKLEVFDIPKITKRHVQILDMNFLWQPNIIERIEELAFIKINNRVVYYEAACGLDFRLLTQEVANTLKLARFVKIRIAWDWTIHDQYKIKDTIKRLLNAGYRISDISSFMLTNWRIPREECERKLDLLKVWNVKVCDCCWDGGYKFAVPEFWKQEDIEEFRAKCRKHNQLVGFGIDPQPSINVWKGMMI